MSIPRIAFVATLVSTAFFGHAAPPAAFTGTARVFDLDLPMTLAFDDQGRVVWDVQGRVHVRSGFDGGVAWSDDFSTPPRTLHFRERDAVVLLGSLLSGTWNDVDGPLVRTPDKAFSIRGGSTSGQIELDPEGRPSRVRVGEGAEAWTIALGGWAELAGRSIPTSIEQSEGPAGTMVFTIQGVRSEAAPAFGRPPTTSGAVFDPGVPAALEVRRAKTGHLLVRPRINGQEVGWFIFDTGAGATVLDKATASTLGVEQFGTIGVGGVGGFVSSPLSVPGTFTLGPATIERPVLITLDLAPIGALIGEKLGGIVGYDLISRVVSEINLRDGAISFHDPAAYDPAGHAWTRLYAYERHLCVDAEVEGHPGVFKLDTGANLSLSMHAPAVKRFGMLDDRTTAPSVVGGSGGFRPARKGQVRTLLLGGRTFADVPSTFSASKDGDVTAFTDQATLGNIGGPILREFVLVLNYTRERAALDPLPQAP